MRIREEIAEKESEIEDLEDLLQDLEEEYDNCINNFGSGISLLEKK